MAPEAIASEAATAPFVASRFAGILGSVLRGEVGLSLDSIGSPERSATGPTSTTRPRTFFQRLLSQLGELMIVGGATLVLFPISWLLRRVFGADPAEYNVSFFAFYLAYVINDPHFTVTYLLFYKDARKRAFDASFPLAQRIRWIVSGIVVPIVLVVWTGAALYWRSAQAIGWMVQLMFLLVGWHYVKQGFGMLSVLSARRGIRLTDGERRIVLWHCFAGWAYAWSNPAMPAADYEEKGVIYRSFAHPRWLELATSVVLAASMVALVWMVVARWRRERNMIPLAPFLALLITIWLWTIFSNLDPLLRYIIPALHSIQYLYFVWLMKRNEARASEGPPHFGRPVAVRLGVLALASLALGWLVFHGAPSFLDASILSRSIGGKPDDPLGPTPWFAALYTFVNVHHYFMDHVIWRRENPDTRFLRA